MFEPRHHEPETVGPTCAGGCRIGRGFALPGICGEMALLEAGFGVGGPCVPPRGRYGCLSAAPVLHLQLFHLDPGLNTERCTPARANSLSRVHISTPCPPWPPHLSRHRPLRPAPPRPAGLVLDTHHRDPFLIYACLLSIPRSTAFPLSCLCTVVVQRSENERSTDAVRLVQDGAAP